MPARALRQLREAFAPLEGERARTGPVDPWYALLITALCVVTLWLEPWRDTWSLETIATVGALLALGGFASPVSRQRESDGAVVLEHGAIVTLSAGVILGPEAGVAVAALSYVIGHFRDVNVLGGWHQFLLAVSNMSLTVLVGVAAFHAVNDLTGSIILAAVAASYASEVGHAAINFGWALSGPRSVREILAGHLEDIRSVRVVINSLFLAVASAAVSVDAILVVGLGLPLAYELLLFREQRRSRTLEDQVHELSDVAAKDALTGIPNRRSILEIGRVAHAEAVSAGTDVAVAMVDLDHFKNLNDTLGHQAGDRALVQAAQVLEELMTSIGGAAGRYGGEEFACVFEADDVEQLKLAGELMCDQIATVLEWCSGGASVGITFVSAQDSSLDVALERADQALYTSKEQGRARATVHLRRGDPRATESLVTLELGPWNEVLHDQLAPPRADADEGEPERGTG